MHTSKEDIDHRFDVAAVEVVQDCGWREGRRLVELGVLADGLKACGLCSQLLQQFNNVDEKTFGLGVILLVQCRYAECSQFFMITTHHCQRRISVGY
jgi:hypothetical protein